MHGAHPDPSVTKIGDTYWASATSSNWFPAFPLLYSKDLLNWKQAGYIFNKKPEWADYYFWAPEISYDSGRVYVYYTAHKKNGNLCVGVASAKTPEGPYKDHGPLICQPHGSIDAFPIRDTAGRLFLVWKEDANSVNLPTPIWAQQINEERTALIGERIELFRNDAPWEKELVEGVSMIKRGDYYYAFYAAAGCCGTRCTYVSGVARAPNILGPWEKYPANPILTDDSTWLCKGHGTPVEKDGRYFFLFHGYHRETSAFTGREALLQEFRFTNDNWIQFLGSTNKNLVRREIIRDEFKGNTLLQTWQWNIFKQVDYKIEDGKLKLHGLPDKGGSFIAKTIAGADYTATTTVIASRSNATAGIAAIGDENNILALIIKDYQLQILQVKNGVDSTQELFSLPIREKVYLQMSVSGPYRITFSYSLDGKEFIPINPTPLRGAFLPPWDSPPRAGLISLGLPDRVAVFDRFEIRAGTLKSSQISEEKEPIISADVVLYVLLAAFVFTGIVAYYVIRVAEPVRQ
ncbi:MAG TPA: family 43 glycosylhydrolase [Segetibacter sp.]|jgi:beta-xylosidase